MPLDAGHIFLFHASPFRHALLRHMLRVPQIAQRPCFFHAFLDASFHPCAPCGREHAQHIFQRWHHVQLPVLMRCLQVHIKL
jgi:hypothetical protein